MQRDRPFYGSLSKGKYTFDLVAYDLDGKKLFQQAFQTTLYEGQIERLRGSLAEMKWGFGITGPCIDGRCIKADIERAAE